MYHNCILTTFYSFIFNTVILEWDNLKMTIAKRWKWHAIMLSRRIKELFIMVCLFCYPRNICRSSSSSFIVLASDRGAKTSIPISFIWSPQSFLMRSDGVVRLSISPSQGDDPGFKSRSEQWSLVRSLISKQNKCETAKKKLNIKLTSEDVGRSISSIAEWTCRRKKCAIKEWLSRDII